MSPAAVKRQPRTQDQEVTGDGLLKDDPALRGHQRNEEMRRGNGRSREDVLWMHRKSTKAILNLSLGKYTNI